MNLHRVIVAILDEYGLPKDCNQAARKIMEAIAKDQSEIMEAIAKDQSERHCRKCYFWKRDRGMFTVTGWTGADREDGYCRLEPKVIEKSGDSTCRHFVRKVDA
jgi:hypothetical protein